MIKRIHLVSAIGVGSLVRLFPVLIHDFPLNDGGMFFAMTNDLMRSNFVLPIVTSYNNAGIPFAYPPLPFYLASALSQFMNVPLTVVFRYLPALISIMTIVAFGALARDILRRDWQVMLALGAFALLPRAFEWLIFGGGLTRAPGLFFALLTLHGAYRLCQGIEIRRNLVVTTVFGTLTVMSHLETAWFAALTCGVFVIFGRPTLRALRYSLLVLMGILLATSPWWLLVLARSGPSPFIYAFSAGNWSLAFIWTPLFRFTEEPFLGLLAVLGLMGLLIAVSKRNYLLPAWLVVTLVLDPRSSATFASVPLAMLISLGVDEGVLPVASADADGRAAGDRTTTSLNRGRLPSLVLAFILIQSVASDLAIPYLRGTSMSVVSADERRAMSWVASNTNLDSRFLVITNREHWESDPVSEWFPVTAERVSLATVQGSEWLANQHFREEAYVALQRCSVQDIGCLNEWRKEFGDPYTHIFITTNIDDPSRANPSLIFHLENSPLFAKVYDSSSVKVFALLDAASS